MQTKSEGILLENSLSPGETSLVLGRPSTDWMRPAHVLEDDMVYSEFTNLNVNLIQKHSSSWHIKVIIIMLVKKKRQSKNQNKKARTPHVLGAFWMQNHRTP